MHPELERVLGNVPDGGLAELSLDDIRARRSTAEVLEESVSYLRRVIQVRLDILGTELAHRRSGDARADTTELIGRLPEILAEHTRGPGSAQPPKEIRAPQVDAALEAAIDEIVPTSRLAGVVDIDDDELAELIDRLEHLEAEVSATRHSLHSRIDALQAEIIRRYRTGEASVDSLLH
ncbi:RsiG family protein [Actinomarinicola tropica]|uniref:RsiG-like domain-containing protein n=1 Tax=Actinomarinicola tropica TaxID=2789776 RepID=A0A5Q2RIX4_9ACTN|nr:hypothetical protein [Actinomarinicola tropica]QGG93780.1 hypothetical protein GH723_00885 [Actinomarinicola tropica]